MNSQNPLVIDLILVEILSNLNGFDLLSCRLVNRLWDKCVRIRLRQNDPKYQNCPKLCVKFKYSKRRQSYVNVRSSRRNPTSKSLVDFCNYLTSRKNNLFKIPATFPVSTFSFLDGDLGAEDAHLFFREHGDIVKKLDLTLVTEYSVDPVTCTSPVFLHTILSDLLPNLKALRLDSTPPWSEYQNLMQGDHKKIMTLTSIELGRHMTQVNFCRDLLTSCVNLESVWGFDIAFWTREWPEAFKTGLMTCIKGLYVGHTIDDLDDLQDFVKFQPHLHDLSVSFEDASPSFLGHLDLHQILEKILTSSKLTLKRIDPLRPLGFLQGHSLPVMEKVDKIYFNDWSLYGTKPKYFPRAKIKTSMQILPNPLKISQIFPNLKSVVVFLNTGRKEGWWDIFNGLDTIESVTRLEIFWKTGLTLIHGMAQIFPNVRHLLLDLHLDDFLKLNGRLGTFWWTNLEHLELWIYKPKTRAFTPSKMDSVITGVSQKECSDLAKNFEVNEISGFGENLKECPGICDGKDFRRLTISFQFDDDHPTICTPIFTQVAGILGFQRMWVDRGVEVTLTATDPQNKRILGNGLNLMKEYVTRLDLRDEGPHLQCKM